MDVEILRDAASGLFAAIAVDRLVAGRAAGGIRVKRYADEAEACADAETLARAMTEKAALAGIRCGGAKVVVRADGLRDRAAAMRLLGERVEARRGALFVGPDFGFTEADRREVARSTSCIDAADVAASTARATALSVRESIAAALGAPPGASLAGARIGIQGLGKVGGALAALLLEEGAAVSGHDLDLARAAQCGADFVSESDLFDGGRKWDALAPCALGGAIDLARAGRLCARAVVGAANHLLASPEDEVAAALERRGIVYVPDFLANAGAFVYWAATVLDGASPDRARAAVLRIGETAREVLARARAERRPPLAVARALARERLAAAARR